MKNSPKIIGSKLICKCGNELRPTETAYGLRAICFPCNIRWTWITGESSWVAETR